MWALQGQPGGPASTGVDSARSTYVTSIAQTDRVGTTFLLAGALARSEVVVTGIGLATIRRRQHVQSPSEERPDTEDARTAIADGGAAPPEPLGIERPESLMTVDA